MNVTIQYKKGFIVAGIDAKSIDPSECPSVWDRLNKKYTEDDFFALGGTVSVGMCHDMVNPNSLNNLAGYIIEDIDKAKEMGLDILEVEATQYAVIELIGSIPESIKEGWKYAMEDYFPKNGYMHSGKPDFEYYYEGEMDKEDYKMELWIPIINI